jgi:hypothetical protein
MGVQVKIPRGLECEHCAPQPVVATASSWCVMPLSGRRC